MSAATMNSSNNNPWPSLTEVYNESKSKSNEEGEGWELLADSDEQRQDDPSSSHAASNSDDFEEVGIKDLPENPKILHHCASSPDLRYLGRKIIEAEGSCEGFEVEELQSSPVVVSMPQQQGGAGDDDNSSAITGFTLADAPSVTTTSSWGMVSNNNEGKTSTTGGTVKRVLSFKDIIMAQQQKEKEQQQKVKFSAGTASAAEPKKSPVRKNKPKFQVVAVDKSRIHNSKSTGDLLSLIVEEDEDGGGGGGGEILGATDAMEYYHRKGKGAISHKAGLRTRPDEAKRKAMIVAKKDLQRKQQQAKQ